jgi:hypothetical protein
MKLIIIIALLLICAPVRAQQTPPAPDHQQMLDKMPKPERARITRAYAQLTGEDRRRADEALRRWYQSTQFTDSFSKDGFPVTKHAAMGGLVGLAMGGAATAAGYATALGLRVAADAPRYVPLLFKGMSESRVMALRLAAYQSFLKVKGASTRYLLPATAALALIGGASGVITGYDRFKGMEREQRTQNQDFLAGAVGFIEGLALARRAPTGPTNDPDDPDSAFLTLREGIRRVVPAP